MEVSTLKKMIDDLCLCEEVKVEKTGLIIDGNALYYSLYYTSDPKLDQRCGGDYPGFKHEVCQFFKTLQDCEVNPYVILDGGSGPEKHERNVSSLKYKLKKAKTIAETEPDGTLPEAYNVLPPLVKDVFIEILREKGIEFKQCLGEADPEVVSEANQKQCAVLSIDKDFHIFDVHKGFLYLDNFEWKKEEDGKIPAKIYKRSKFCEHFKLDPALMPVFASIAGNDYSRLEDNGGFSKESSSPGVNSIKRLDGMLGFLSKVNLDDLNDLQKRERALSEALNHVGKKENQTFKLAIKKYVKPEKTSSKLPPWVCEKVERGELTSFTTSVVDQKTILLTALVEDFSQRSSYKAAYCIRQYFYGLLTGGEMCTEYGRDGEEIKDDRVPSILPSSDEQKQLKLQRLHKAPEGLRRRVFEQALQVQTSDLENIPDQLKLPVCVTVFWFKRLQHHSKPETVYCLHALLLWFVCEPDGPEDEFERRMKALKDEGVSNWQPRVAHAFSQWQCCMRQSLHLNQLLCSPLPEPQCAR
ncbi:protein asteroid homolog 1-like [Pelmatolapia mariae]